MEEIQSPFGQEKKMTPKKNQKKRSKFVIWLEKNWGQIFIVIGLLILAVLVLYPLFIMVLRSFKFPEDDVANPFGLAHRYTFDNYITIWSYIKNSYLKSFITTIGVTAGTVICASFLAYAFIRFRFPFKKFFFYAIISLMMIPGILTLISRYQQIVDMKLTNNLLGIILPGIAGYIPMAFMLLFTFFNGLPKELFEAADMDGAGDFKVYFKIVVPLSRPIIWTIGIQTFVGEWNDFLWAKLVLVDDDMVTLPVVLNSISQDLGESIAYALPFAGYVLSALPLLLILIVASKQFIEGLTSGAFKM